MQDMERPLYMQPKDAISYNVCDGIVRPRTAIIDEVKKAEAWCARLPRSSRTHSASLVKLYMQYFISSMHHWCLQMFLSFVQRVPGRRLTILIFETDMYSRSCKP